MKKGVGKHSLSIKSLKFLEMTLMHGSEERPRLESLGTGRLLVTPALTCPGRVGHKILQNCLSDGAKGGISKEQHCKRVFWLKWQPVTELS